MEGKKIVAQLHTPIMIEESDKTLGPIFQISGTILEENSGGIALKISEVKTEKGETLHNTRSELFLPFHKIDHIFFEGK